MEAMSSPSGSLGAFRRKAAVLCLLAATVVAAGEGADVVYRLRLFWYTYHGEPGMSHVDDSYFSTAYKAGAVAIVMALAAASLFRGWLWPVTAILVGALNLASCAAVFSYTNLTSARAVMYADIERTFFKLVIHNGLRVAPFYVGMRDGSEFKINLRTFSIHAAATLFTALDRHGIPMEVNSPEAAHVVDQVRRSQADL